MTLRQRALSIAWESWPDWHYKKGKSEIESKLCSKRGAGTNKSDMVGIELEYDVWLLCEPLAKAGIQMHWQYRIRNGEHKADIFLRRVRYHAGRDVILSVKDLMGSGSHDKKITDDVEFAKRERIPIQVVVQGGNLGRSVQNYLARNPNVLIWISDLPSWVQKVAEAQALPDDIGIRVLKSRNK